jgi:hypothetical protein
VAPVFFTDRNLGKQFPAILAAAGMAIERHCDHFRDNAPDEEWIAEVARRGWIAITHDKEIRRRPNQRAAVISTALGLIVVIGRLPFPELAAYFARSRAKIDRFVLRTKRPWIARFYAPTPQERERKLDPAGRIELWLTD